MVLHAVLENTENHLTFFPYCGLTLAPAIPPLWWWLINKRKQDFQLNSKLDSNSEVDENKGQKEILR